jgi:EmrB/QacA subfamily drug resistance transporter
MESGQTAESARPGAAEGESQAAYGNLSRTSAILVLAGVFFAVLMGAMDGLVVSTVLPTIASDLHQVNGVTFVAGAYLISSTIAIPVFARLSDISSRRNVFLAGLAVFIAGSALAGLSQNLPELIVFRAVQGAGGGGVFPVAIAMVAVLFPPQTRARAVGVLTGAAGIAIVLGPLVGSYIVSVTTWRWVFYINLPFGVLAMVVTLLALGPLRPLERGTFDLPGAGLLTGWVGALMVALVEVSDSGWSWTDPRIIGLLLSSAVLFALFLWFELRTREPLVPLRLMGQRVIGASSGIMFSTGIVFSSLISFLSVFVGIVMLQNGPNATSDVRDVIYFLAVPLILGAALAGQILTKAAYRTVIAPGLVLASVSAYFLTHLTPSTPLWTFASGFIPDGGLALPLIPLGFGLGFALSGPTVAVQNEAPREEVGAAIGLTRFFQSLGGAVGISLLTAFETWRAAELSGPEGLVTTFDEIFVALMACVVLAFAFSLFIKGRVPQAPADKPTLGGHPNSGEKTVPPAPPPQE